MEDSRFIKAFCPKAKRYLGLEAKQFEEVWKIVNVFPLSSEEAKLISTDVDQRVIETNQNLLECRKCGNRKMSGCSCSKYYHECSHSMKHQFDCVYCADLKIDYSIPSEAEIEGRIGETIVLSQGQEVPIRYIDNRPLAEIHIGVSWDPGKGKEKTDVDAAVVILPRENNSRDIVYFGNKIHSSGCAVHHGDDLTGKKPATDDDESIEVFLDKVPNTRDRLVFVLNIFKSSERRQTLDKVKELVVRVSDSRLHEVLVEYRIEQDLKDFTALIIGMVIRKDGEWSFKAIGKGSKADDLRALAAECESY